LDSTSLVIAGLVGALLGAVLVAARLRPALSGARRERERLRREGLELVERITELENTARRADTIAATRVEEPVREAHRVLRGRSDAQLAMSRGIEELEKALGVGVGRGATVIAHAHDFEGNARRAELAVAEQGQRMRAIAAEAEAAVQAADIAASSAAALSEVLGNLDRGSDAVAGAASETVDSGAMLDGALRRLQAAAGETAEHSSTVAAEAERGYRAVHRTLDEMERIRELAEAARRGIEALAERVFGVGEVVRVIQEIAEKTNLLALNASIIAAQAGPHGRSFAVVAQEIKALAQKTGSSTKQIGELIRSVREESERAMEAMSSGAAAVAQGFEVALGAGDALGEIRQSARVAQKRVQTMMRSMDEESSAAARVLDAARALAERASAMAHAVKEQGLQRARLSDAAQGIVESGGRLGRLAREQLEGGRTVVEVVARLAAETTGVARGQKELRRHIDRIHSGAAQLSGLESEVAGHIAGVAEAAVLLREELARLSVS
jgi:methyl-accepting chemotaxis protein